MNSLLIRPVSVACRGSSPLLNVKHRPISVQMGSNIPDMLQNLPLHVHLVERKQ